MSKFIFIALVVGVASFYRSKCNELDMSWQQRMARGTIGGLLAAAGLVAATFWQVHTGERESLDQGQLFWVCLLFVGAGAVSLLRGGPGDSPESFDFDDPNNITPKQRVEKAKQHGKNT